MEHQGCLDYCRHWRRASAVILQGINAAAVLVEVRSYQVVMVVEKRVLMAEAEEALMVGWEKVVREARSVAAGTTAISFEMVKYLVEKELCEPNVRVIRLQKYLRNNTPPSRTRISHNTSLSASNSTHFPHQLPI